MAIIPKEKAPEAVEQKPSETEQERKKHSLYLKTFSFAIEFGFIIALPLVGFGYLGKFLDQRYQTNNKIFLYAGILLALATTCLLFMRKIKDIMKDMQK
jgi:hypothetical protein